jgi:hypothetical protein
MVISMVCSIAHHIGDVQSDQEQCHIPWTNGCASSVDFQHPTAGL